MDPNTNEIAANVISQQITNITDFAGEKLSRAIGGLQVQFKLGLTSYLSGIRERLSRVKTLLYRDAPIPIEKIYVNLNVVIGKVGCSDADLLSDISKKGFIAITGTAGTGKSMLMRHLFLRALADKKRVPIFFELRNLNAADPNETLIQVLQSNLGPTAPFNRDQMELGLKLGIFTFFFDGFDEINHEQREQVEARVLALSTDFPKNRVVISSRPDDTFASWTAFHVYQVRPLSKDQTVELIGKLDYDEEVKNKFVEEIKDHLYVQHEEFLSNPLLATMMLLTYDQFADIPSKVHVFYQQAFETLFQKHDALKSVYRRKTYSGLAIDEFKRCFASFCALTYFDEKFSLNDEELRAYAEKAIAVSGVGASVENLSRDMLESVCVLQREGLHLVFVHRSFQEYFTAYFVVVMNADRAGAFIERLEGAKARTRDNVVSMCFDMNTDIVEAQWALPALQKLATAIRTDLIYDYRKTFEALFEGVLLAMLPRGVQNEVKWVPHLFPEHRSRILSVLGALYDWRVLGPQKMADLEVEDIALANKILDGEVIFPNMDGDARSTLNVIRRGTVSDKEHVGRVSRLASAPLSDAELTALENTTVGHLARAYWEATKRTLAFVEKRAGARQSLFEGLLSLGQKK